MIRVRPFTQDDFEVARSIAEVRRPELSGLPAARYPAIPTGLPGAAAFDGEDLVGFLTAYDFDSLRGHRSAFSPEWAHGVIPGYEQVFAAMYAQVAGLWRDLELRSHVFTTYPNDAMLRAMQWQGFGAIVADGIRPLDDVDSPSGVSIRKATIDDAGELVRLSAGLVDHLASSPVLLRFPYRSLEYWQNLLADASNVLLLGSVAGRCVAYLKLGPCAGDVCWSVRSPGTMSISGAFCEPEYRCHGVAQALLQRGIETARESGYERCAVDWETNNVEANRFWTRHFGVVAVSMRRSLDALC